jgi:hypothetical protein
MQEYVDFTLIFPSGEKQMDATTPATVLGFELTQLPIMFLALSAVCFAVAKGYLILPGVNLPPIIWQVCYLTRGRYWRIKNNFKNYWRFMRQETRLRREMFTRWRKGNPKTTDLGKLFLMLIRTTLERELHEGGINANNQKDWLERFSIVKGLENLRPYHATPKMTKTRGNALKTEIKDRLGNGFYKQQAKLPVEQKAKSNVVTIRRVTSGRGNVRVLKLKSKTASNSLLTA